MGIQIEAGKYYTDRKGRVYGPMVTMGGFCSENLGIVVWYNDGHHTNNGATSIDLIAEHTPFVACSHFVTPVDGIVFTVGYGAVGGASDPDGSSDGYVYTTDVKHVLRSGVDQVMAFGKWHPYHRIAVTETLGESGFKHVRYLKSAAPIAETKAESPEDWVMLPEDHVMREGIDWIEYTPEDWHPVVGYAGITVANLPDGRCRCRRKDMPTAPVESPEDWVEITHTHPDHVPRVGIDWFTTWADYSLDSDKWTKQESIHSDVTVGKYYDSHKRRHRCRRKDLPGAQNCPQEWTLCMSKLNENCSCLFAVRSGEEIPECYTPCRIEGGKLFKD